ncbi:MULTISPECIES: TasA family protein [Halorussus]|uniref:TasA family protein n=1 Tax=Halorussus TaxID=1070314 RepID=UPI000E21150A|nr:MULTISPECIES: TasA family protein [Halorussus]NHN61154.1 hypothetical protein [Halorussus sp. JP-T4]
MTEDDNSGFDLSRRKVLGGLVTVGAASAATGAGTMAYFSDTESSEGNTVSAGTLNLKVNGRDDISTAPVNVSGVAPGWSKSIPLDLSNDGTVGGDLYLKFDVTGSNDGDGDSQGLEDDLDLTWNVDNGGSGSIDLTNAPTNWQDTGQDIGGSSNVTGDIGLELPTSVGNEAQGESATIDVYMKLVQSGGSP